MSAYKDSTGPNGRWRWRARVRNPHTGQEARLSGSAPRALNTRKAAEQDERAAVEAFRGDPRRAPIGEMPTLADFVERFYRPWLTLTRKARSTVEARESHLATHILPAFGQHRLVDITKQEVKAWIAKLLTTVGETGSVRTVQTIRNTLHSILVRAVDEELLPAVPRFPKLPPVEQRAPEFLDFTEASKLCAAAANDEERALFLVAMRCGLRASEQKALRWDDISWERKTLHIQRAFVRGELKATKGRSDRIVDLDDETEAALRKIRSLQQLVFCQADGSHLKYHHLERRLHGALARASVKRVRWHDLRHTFGSHLAIAGVPLIVIRDLMGHKSVKTTEIYAHLIRSSGREALAMVERKRAGIG